MFKKILIANRGEIALRIARTCRELGVFTIAIYSDLDRKAPYVYFADEAYNLSGKTSTDTYLNADKIIHIARQAGAEAIHPGYGFLAENAAFARAIEKSGMKFIGPPARAIEVMGNKTAARQLMKNAGVPIIPGTESALQDLKEAESIAADIGFPVLIKASSGGGGKGMRLVFNKKELPAAIESARSEAASSFGDATVYIEKYLEEPRHIEFQILADEKGTCIHLGERECSIQRRHQKIIEEAPSSVLNASLREKMGAAAVRAAQACGYSNAGTIEFLVDKNHDYYFLEMNTRLQVEHPVTELVTGLDLVLEQLLIASGEKMTRRTSISNFNGHALESRIYAENPDNNFAPSPGVIYHISSPGIREDSGVTTETEISLFYDPLISKLCTWAPDRQTAINRMIRALSEYELQGIHSTIPFLIKVMKHPRFISGEFNTNFIQEETDLFESHSEKSKIAALAAVILQQEEKETKKLANPFSNENTGWKQTKRKIMMSKK
jgi:acetyl-CoA carboxylase biotin carboxylase subunit